MKLKGPWVCLALTFGPSLVYANVDLDAYRQGDYSKALERLSQSDRSDPMVNYYLARMRLYGYGDLRKNSQAMNTFVQAANAGSLAAQQLLARFELLGEKKPELALVWFKKVAAQNDVAAQMYCAAAYLFGFGTTKNLDMARNYYIMAARNGNALAQFALAQRFLTSRYDHNEELGMLWLHKALAQNNPEAQWLMGQLNANDAIEGATLAQAKEYYSKAAAVGYLPAQMSLAELYYKPNQALTNPNMGFELMLNIAQQGYLPAQRALVKIYHEGLGVSANEKMAMQWEEKANATAKVQAENPESEMVAWLTSGKAKNFSESDYRLSGIMGAWHNAKALKDNHYNPAPQMPELTASMIFKPDFRLVLPNKIPFNVYYQAMMTTTGSLPNDPRGFPHYAIERGAGLDELKTEAVLGQAQAQFMLAQHYQYGEGVKKSVQEAEKYYLQAAEQQHIKAIYELGLLYLEQGTTAEAHKEGLNYINDAAFKGNPYAEYTLGLLHEFGYQKGTDAALVNQDNDQAIGMYNLSSANNFPLAKYRLAENLLRLKNTDQSFTAQQERNEFLQKLYQDAVDGGVTEAELPLAFYYAMDRNPIMQKRAFAIAEKAALHGNSDASLLLGLLYDRGAGVPISSFNASINYKKAPESPIKDFINGTYFLTRNLDKNEALPLLEKSAAAGFAPAYLNLAAFKKEQGKDFLPDLNQALKLGNSQAGLLLADYYVSGAEKSDKAVQARTIYQQFANRGDGLSQLKLAYMLEQGIGGEVNRAEAATWYEQAAKQGDSTAQYLLGHLYQMGWLDKEPNYVAAKQWYEQAKNHFPKAAVALGFINDTVDDDYQNAIVNYQLAANQGDITAQYNLGLMYEFGKGCPVDYKAAEMYYLRASKANHNQAMAQLGALDMDDSSNFSNPKRSLRWYQKAAQLHNADALYQLGLLSETGALFKINLKQASQYYQEAAKQGHMKAMFALARLYQYGLAGEKNLDEAFNLYKKLADLGNPYAQYQLAMFYYQGLHGAPNKEEGRRLLMQAQQNGCTQAQQALDRWENGNAQGKDTSSYLESVSTTNEALWKNKSAEWVYFEAINDWNKGEDLSAKKLLKLLVQHYPDSEAGKQASLYLSEGGIT